MNHPLAALAGHIAAKAHADQATPWSGEPVVQHTRQVARLVARLDSTDAVDVAAGHLHLVLETTAMTAPDLIGGLVAGGAGRDEATEVVRLVEELTGPFTPRVPHEERRLQHARLRRAGDRAKRIKLCDFICRVLDGGARSGAAQGDLLADALVVADLCGLADPILAGWLLTLIGPLGGSSNPVTQEVP